MEKNIEKQLRRIDPDKIWASDWLSVTFMYLNGKFVEARGHISHATTAKKHFNLNTNREGLIRAGVLTGRIGNVKIQIGLAKDKQSVKVISLWNTTRETKECIREAIARKLATDDTYLIYPSGTSRVVTTVYSFLNLEQEIEPAQVDAKSLKAIHMLAPEDKKKALMQIGAGSSGGSSKYRKEGMPMPPPGVKWWAVNSESFKHFVESVEELELRHELKHLDPDMLINADLNYQIDLPDAYSEKKNTITFTYSNGGIRLSRTQGGRHKTHIDMQMDLDSGPVTRQDMIKKGMLLGRIGTIRFTPGAWKGKTIKVVSFWNANADMGACVRELLHLKLIDQETYLVYPENQVLTVNEFLGAAHSPVRSTTVDLELLRKMHTLPPEQKKQALNSIGSYQGGSSKTAGSKGIKPWALTSESSELLLEYKFMSNEASICAHCHSPLIADQITENPKHLYTIGQLFLCRCKASSLWTNSVRDEKQLLNFIEGKTDRYYKGFCNDLFCGKCYGMMMPIKNGYTMPGFDIRFDLYGCRNCDNVGVAIGRKDPENAETTLKLIKWYAARKNRWEQLVQ